MFDNNPTTSNQITLGSYTSIKLFLNGEVWDSGCFLGRIDHHAATIDQHHHHHHTNSNNISLLLLLSLQYSINRLMFSFFNRSYQEIKHIEALLVTIVIDPQQLPPPAMVVLLLRLLVRSIEHTSAVTASILIYLSRL